MMRLGHVLKISVVLSFTLCTSCLIYNQNINEKFKDKNIPKELYELSNQITDLKKINLSKINKRKGIRVAVIDNGVDLTHPDLIESLDYSVNDLGEITAVGKDIMGGDPFASANLIKYDLYSFSLNKFNKGLSYEKNEKPLEIISQINQDFLDSLELKIKKSPDLKNSFFYNLDLKKNITVFNVFLSKEDDFWNFEDSFYAEEISELVSLKTKTKLKTNKKFRKKVSREDYNLKVLRVIENYELDQGILYPEEGVSPLLQDLVFLDSREEFKKLAFKALDEVQEKYSLKERYENMIDFYMQHKELENDDEKYKRINFVNQRLNKALSYQIRDAFKRLPCVEVEKRAISYIQNFYSRRGYFYKASFDPVDLSLSEMKNLVYQPDSDVNSLELSEKLKQSLPRFKEGFQNFNGLYSWLRGQSFSACGRNSGRYDEFLRKTISPYLSEDSFKATHGTHVSGIVSIQHPQNKVYPIRVTTRGIKVSREKIKNLQISFKNEFQEWLKNEVVYQGLIENFPAFFLDFAPKENNLKNLEHFSDYLYEKLKRIVTVAIYESSIDHIFINQLVESIKHIGKSKIKVANISLGTDYERDVPSPDLEDVQTKLKSFYEFLLYEFFKTKIANAIQNYSKNTIFVVAAGNSSKWVNGTSRSALPADLRSPIFLKYERDDLKLSNNHLKNILAVGSLAKDDRMSSFTNILIGSKNLPPFVLAHGENILSPVRIYDKTEIKSFFKGQFPFVPLLFESNLSKLYKLSKKLEAPYPKTQNILTKKQIKSIKDVIGFKKEELFEKGMGILGALWDNIIFELSLSYPLKRARLSGTSMAAPAVSGHLAGYINEKMKNDGISEDELYDDPEYDPQKMIQEAVLSQSENDGPIRLSRLINLKMFDEDNNLKKLEKFILKIKKEGIKNNENK